MKYYFSYGKSDNSKLNVELGSVLRVASEEVLKYENNGYPYYHGYINRVMEEIPEKNISDSLSVLDKLSAFQPKRMPIEEITRIEASVVSQEIQQEEIYFKPSSSQFPSEQEPGKEEILEHKMNISNDMILQWVKEKKIPDDIYKKLAKDNEPLPKKFYVDQREGEAWAQMHFRGIPPDTYKDIKSGKISLEKGLVGHSVHIDLRINYKGLNKLVQYVITENDVQSMIRMMKGEKRTTAGGVENVQHSLVVSKPSGEPPESLRYYSESDNSKGPSIDEEGAKLANEIIIKDGSYWIEPGDIGATVNTYSYMALIWMGKVVSGCERHDLHELFLFKEKAKDDIFSGKFTIKCLKRPDATARWEIWKAISDPKPMDSIMHSDCGYHYLVPEDKVDGFNREYYRKESERLFKEKLK